MSAGRVMVRRSIAAIKALSRVILFSYFIILLRQENGRVSAPAESADPKHSKPITQKLKAESRFLLAHHAQPRRRRILRQLVAAARAELIGSAHRAEAVAAAGRELAATL